MAGAEAEELAVLEDAEQGAEFANIEDLAGLGISEERAFYLVREVSFS